MKTGPEKCVLTLKNSIHYQQLRNIKRKLDN